MWISSASCLVVCTIFIGLFEIFGAQKSSDVAFRSEWKAHKSKRLNDEDIMNISNMANESHFETVLDTILVPRVVGTRNHEQVKQYLIQSMKNLGWDVETDAFEDDTPTFGRLKFENIIARLNPNAKRFIALACHYDSKYFREGSFVGATDSAVPCAMMINLAQVMKKQLDSIKSQDTVSLKFIFFDGEEAFKSWGPTDSIYGAKHLAAKWEKTPYFPHMKNTASNYLHRLDMLVLLDLLGAPDPMFYNFFSNTVQWYQLLVQSERKLASLHQLQQYRKGQPYFQQMSNRGTIEDDHIPFAERDVPILHIIPYPFPEVWHTQHDNRDVVNITTVENLNKIFRVFVAAYLHLST